ncbi:hypothetical protein AB6F61_03595 [Providencia hangzhouensis]|uniref:hypothetical protein n=1 Tax=Providencia TaxID=586 RepID=UPI0021ABE0CB|nr:hypothetical protein [Providencia rettgeri]
MIKNGQKILRSSGFFIFKVHSAFPLAADRLRHQLAHGVLCALDGYVYIGGEGSSLWRGRKFQWEKLYHGGSTILLNQLRWFEDKVWACDDYRLQCWDGNEMVRSMDGDETVLLSGHMDVRDGILVVAGDYSVDLYDGTAWHKIVRPYS